MQVHVVQPKSWKDPYQWTSRKLLDNNFNEPKTLEDIGLTLTAVEQVQQTLFNIWSRASTISLILPSSDSTEHPSPQPLPVPEGPFQDLELNEVWRVLTWQMQDNYNQLADMDMLEADPASRKAAMAHPRLRPFWMASEDKKMTGLWDRGCFRKWKRKDLLLDYRVFGSRFHYHIKRDGATGHITNCKVRLVVQGQRMKEGEDYEDSFAPVPHATSCRVIIAMAAAMGLEPHACHLAQAFIQTDKLPEGKNGRVFIRPPSGYPEDDNVVHEVLCPLYWIPSSARALHITLSKFFKEEGFVTAGFEDSIWVREAGGKYPHCFIGRQVASTHIALL